MAPISRLTSTVQSLLLRRSSVEGGGSLIRGSGARWVVIGEAGMKKDFCAERLSKLLQIPHISMPSLVQQQRHQKIVSAGSTGKRVPGNAKFELLSMRLDHGRAVGESGFILTGVPRNKSEAEILDEMVDISLVINFKRLVRTSHQQSIHGVSWLDIVSMSKRQRQESRQRSSSISGNSKYDKLRLYAEEGKEVELHYRRQQKLLNLQLTGAPEETWQGFIASLCLQHMDTINSQRLAA